MGIEVFHPEDENDVDVNLNLRLDIIAVHGLDGDLIRTWTEPKSQKLWLRDFLPSDIPKARVMTYGYGAASIMASSAADIVDHARDLLECLLEKRKNANEAKRPLIFIGHSLGGLVTKQALILAEHEARYRTLYTSTAGIIFFGTPHEGSRIAAYALSIVTLFTIITIKPGPELVKTLKPRSDVLIELTENFKKHYLARPYPITSFYETKTMAGLKMPIVDKTSAIMTAPNESSDEVKIPVPKTHQAMCRFSSPEDQTYKRAVETIKRTYNHGREATIPENEYYVAPHAVNSNFTGRSEILEQLQDCLLPDPHFHPRDQQRFVLFGLGGSGKTQLALRFVQDYKGRFWGVFWIDGTSLETANASFLKVARECSQDENVEKVKAWLSGRDYWLLVIDNVDDQELDLSVLLPSGSRGAVLITTRNPEVRQYGSAGSCTVDKLSDQDAITLLLRTAKPGDTESIQDQAVRESAKKVAEILGNLALAIVQAGAVIRQNICSLDGFCELYSQHKGLLEMGREKGNTNYRYSVYTTWEISIQKIEDLREAPAAFALELLKLFSFMHFNGLSEEIFKNARNNTADFFPECTFAQTIAYKSMPSGWNRLILAQALKILVEFSLVTIDDSRRIAMHPLVHAWSRERMSDSQRAVAWEMATSTLSISISGSPSFLDCQYRRSIIAHIDACLGSEEGRELLFAAGPHLEERLTTASRFSFAYGEAGRFQSALDLELQIQRRKKSMLSEEDPSTLTNTLCIATYLSELGRYKEAADLREHLLEVVSKDVDEGGIGTLMAKHHLAASYDELGQYERARDMMIEVLSGFQQAFGMSDGRTLNAKALLGVCCAKLNRWEEASRLQEEVLRDCERKFGEKHYLTLIAMEFLACTYDSLKLFKKARTLRAKSLPAMKQTLGEEHPDTLVSMMNSAARHGWLDRRKECAARREVARRMEETLGELNPRTLNSTRNLAIGHFMNGSLEKARELQQQVVAGFAKVFGKNHEMTVKARKELSTTERAIALRKCVYWWVPNRIVEHFSSPR